MTEPSDGKVDESDWEPDDAPPPRVAILGGGPIALEAALYARFLGHPVELFERGRIARHVRQWGQLAMFSPFGMNRSNLGLAALAAQDPSYQPPDDQELLTGWEFAERYLQPLAQSDLVSDSLREEHLVLAVGRRNQLKTENVGQAARENDPFCLLISHQGREFVKEAEIVIDATGVYDQPNWLGAGGTPCPGEREAGELIARHIPDFLGADRERFAGQRVLLVGGGYSAATAAVALARLAEQSPGTQTTWITRSADGPEGVMHLIPSDRLAARDALARAANRTAREGTPHLVHHDQTSVASIAVDDTGTGLSVELAGKFAGRQVFDRIVALVGYRPDRELYRELQVHECYASEGPMRLAAALAGEKSADCLNQPAAGPQTLVNPEPGFFILGHKSYGRSSQFLLQHGLAQIRDLFAIIHGRPQLDLYARR